MTASRHHFKLSAALGILPLASNAVLVRHWALDEADLTENINGAWGEVVDSTGNTSDGRLFGYLTDNPLPSGVVNIAGPAGFGTAYDFTEPSGISGVFTNDLTALPAIGDFTVKIQISTINLQSAQGHLFSNNSGQANRTNLYYLNGEFGFFVNGGAFDTTGDGVSDGDAFSVPANGATFDLFDGEFHEVGVGREGNRFDLLVDGMIVGSGTSTTAGTISQAQSWMIGRARSNGSDLDATIADVKVFDSYEAIPEPSSLILLGFGSLFLARRRRS